MVLTKWKGKEVARILPPNRWWPQLYFSFFNCELSLILLMVRRKSSLRCVVRRKKQTIQVLTVMVMMSSLADVEIFS